MDFSYTLTFNAPKDKVLELFCDPSFYPKHQAAMDSINFQQVDSSDDGDHFSIHCEYDVKADDSVPGFAKKVLGDTSHVVHKESWTRSTGKGEVSISISTLPGTISCQTHLEDAGDKTRKVFNWTVKVKIPLVGGKIEKVVAADIEKKSAPDEKAVNAQLG